MNSCPAFTLAIVTPLLPPLCQAKAKCFRPALLRLGYAHQSPYSGGLGGAWESIFLTSKIFVNADAGGPQTTLRVAMLYMHCLYNPNKPTRLNPDYTRWWWWWEGVEPSHLLMQPKRIMSVSLEWDPGASNTGWSWELLLYTLGKSTLTLHLKKLKLREINYFMINSIQPVMEIWFEPRALWLQSPFS